jgi:hypothetical protein
MDMGMDMEKSGGGGTELPQELANVVMSSMRQGLIIINDPREAEEVVRIFTAMIVNKDPNKVNDWHREYITVSNEEFQEELKLLAMPLALEQSVMLATEYPGGREFPVIMRKIYIVSFVNPLSFIVFSQPSIALLARDGDRLFLGFKGVDPSTGSKIVVTIKAKAEGVLTVPFTPAVARFVFVGDVVEAVIDDGGQVRGLRH